MNGTGQAVPWLPSEAGAAARRHAPATLRNRDAIAEVLADILPDAGLVLEIASGSGEHVVHFADCFRQLIWQPSDPDPDALVSIEAWRQEGAAYNVRPPLRIDAAAPEWGVRVADAVLCINMVHISPWEATLGLLAGARRVLESRQPLFLYGPFAQGGVVMAPSNEAFDRSLRARDPRWGLRAVEAVIEAARERGFGGAQIISMPANNLSIVLRAG